MSDDRLTVPFGAAVAVIVAGVLLAHVWGARLPAGGDVTGHLVRTQVGATLVRHLRLDGWSPRFGLGYQQYLVYGPGFTWLLLGLRALTFGVLSNAGAIKAVTLASFAAIGPAAVFTARSLGLGRRASAVAGVLALVVSNPFGVGFQGTFDNGLIPQQVAAVLFLFALGAAVRRLGAGSRRWTLVFGVTVAAVLITHVITFNILGCFVAGAVVLTLVDPPVSRREVLRATIALAGATAAAAAVCAFWLVPALAHESLHGPVVTWAPPSLNARFSDVLAGRILYWPLAAKVIAAGALYGIVRIGFGRRFAVLVAFLPAAWLAAVQGAYALKSNSVTINLPNRGLGLAGILFVFPLAALLAAVSRRAHPQAWWATALVFVVALPLVVRAPARRTAGQDRPAKPDLRATAMKLRTLVPPGARFATVRDYPGEIDRTGVQQPDRWLAWVSGRPALNTFPVEASTVPKASFEAEELGHEPVERSAELLPRFGVTHVVATSAAQVERLTTSDVFHPVWARGTMTVLDVRRPSPGPPIAGQLTFSAGDARVVAAGDDHLVMDASAAESQLATVALAWSPKWHATVGARSVPVHRTRDGLLAVTLPAEPTRVDLRFRDDGWDWLGRAVSLASVIGLVVGARRARRRH